MTTTSRRLRRTVSTAAAAAIALGAAAAPAAFAQGITPPPPPATGVGPVDTVLGSLSGGVQPPHPFSCEESRPEVQELITGVRRSLTTIYPDITTMAARGFFPYIDAPLFGLSGGQGHWINPGHIEDVYPEGHPKAGQPRLADPEYPESILVDRWNRPIGIMFIGDGPDKETPDIYESDEGVPCNPWHHHTETAADAYWYAYKYGWSGDIQEGDVMPPDRTPDLLHVWRYGDYQYQWNHKTPPQEQMPGDPDDPQELRQIVGGPRTPVDPPEPDGR